MKDLIIIKEKPQVPDNWDYDTSVNKVKQIVYKWKNLTEELAVELFNARNVLSVLPEERERTTTGAFAPLDKTWAGYCDDIGVDKSTANRWLNRWFEPEKLVSQVSPMPTDKYNIILADPPWQYWEGGLKNQSQHYKTMTLEEIRNLPVNDIAADDCILFLWATFPVLPDILEVIKSWGFDYSTVGFVWVKSKKDGTGFDFGCGNWTRANVELCLIATKGSIPRQDASISQIIYEPKREHSRKPDIVRKKIIQLVGDLPRIELFAREQKDGFDVWGNETDKFNE